jgi:hypothetical protein
MDEWDARGDRLKEMLALGLSPDEAVAETRRAEARAGARAAWAKARIEALRDAQKRCDAAWMKLVAEHPGDDDDDMPPPPEQAEVDRILAELDAVRHHDRWPRHLHWGDV